VIILEAKNVELKIQRLVDINRGEEDDHLFKERQSRDCKTIKKIQKIKTAGENEDNDAAGKFQYSPTIRNNSIKLDQIKIIRRARKEKSTFWRFLSSPLIHVKHIQKRLSLGHRSSATLAKPNKSSVSHKVYQLTNHRSIVGQINATISIVVRWGVLRRRQDPPRDRLSQGQS
jgi:hypothetical protein